MSLSTGQIVVITASLAVVGGVTIYFIARKKDEPPHGAPAAKKTTPKRLTRSQNAQRHPAHTPPRPPQYYAQPAPQQQYAFRQPREQRSYAHDAPPQYTEQQHYAPQPHYYNTPAPQHHDAPPVYHETAPVPQTHEDVTYTPFSMPPPPTPQPTPSAQAMNPTYWRDLATSLSILSPTAKLISVKDAQQYLNQLGVNPHGEVLKVDDDLGSRTRNALSNFQELHHLPMTGNLDAETGAALLYDSYMKYRAQAGGAT